QQQADYLIRNANIIDGTGQARYKADVAVLGDRIHFIGDAKDWSAKTVVDAQGLALVPGFIDTHTHDDRLMLSDGAMVPKVSQGITTVVAGNCGISLAPASKEMLPPITPPLDLLDHEGKWFSYPTFDSYLSPLSQQAPASNSVLF